MTKDDILDVAILVTEHLLDNAPELLNRDVLEVDGQYTELTFHLQDSIADALGRSKHTCFCGRPILKKIKQ